MKWLMIFLFSIPVCTMVQAQPLPLWSNTYGTSTDAETINSVLETSSGFLLLGTIYEQSCLALTQVRVYLVKTDQAGNAVTTNILGSNFPRFEGASLSGYSSGYVISGCISTTLFGNSSPHLMIIDQNAVITDDHTFGMGSGNSGAFHDALESNGSVFAVGIGYNTPFNYNLAARYDPAFPANTWFISFPAAGNSELTAISATPDQKFIAVGSKTNPDGEVYIVKFNSVGNIIWERTYGNIFQGYHAYDRANAVSRDTHGSCYIAGSTEDGSGHDSALLIRTDSAGYLLWQKILYAGVARSVSVTSDNGCIVTGSKGTPADSTFIMKFDENGQLLFSSIADICPGCTFEQANKIIETASHDYVVAGTRFVSPGSCDDGFLTRIKYKYWTGFLNDDWNHMNNWSPRGIPLFNENIYIAMTSFGSPPSFGPSPTLEVPGTCASLTIKNGRVVLIKSGGTLDIHGNLLIEQGGQLTNNGLIFLRGNLANQNP